MGARAVGLDLAERQLAHAREFQSVERRVPLVQGNAEQLPFQNDVFDIVFCDHGATVFAPPEATVSEASRVLKRGGLFAFCMSTPMRDICFDSNLGTVKSELAVNYFELSAFDDGQTAEHQLPYGAWIRLTSGNSKKPADNRLQSTTDAIPPRLKRKRYADHWETNRMHRRSKQFTERRRIRS